MEAEQYKTSAVTQALHKVTPIHQVLGFIREGTITNMARQRSAVESDNKNLHSNQLDVKFQQIIVCLCVHLPICVTNFFLPVCPCCCNILVCNYWDDNKKVASNGKESDEVDENSPEADWPIRAAIHGNKVLQAVHTI